MIIPRLGYDVRRGSSRADPPDVETPTDHAEPEIATCDASRAAVDRPPTDDASWASCVDDTTRGPDRSALRGMWDVYSCIEGTYEMPTIAPSGDSSRTTV
jgi:hypothetical protein